MYSVDKTSSFLKAIDKYAREEKFKIAKEMREIEEKELKKAEIAIMEDVKHMAQKEHMRMKNKITIDISHKELDERKKLAQKRQCIVKDVFTLCREKLIKFSDSSKYPEYLCKYAYKIASVLNASDVVLYIRKKDEEFIDMIKASFESGCEIKYDDEIIIGGIRGVSMEKGIVADETLDSKLEAQKDWFSEKYGIMLV